MKSQKTKIMSLIASMIFANLSNASAFEAKDNRIDIWPTIPFARGADLCAYKDAYEGTRSEYLKNMTKNASSLLHAGASGKEAYLLLSSFNDLYNQNIQIATMYRYLDVTLESTFKAYLDGYYRDIKPKTKKISFSNTNDILSVIQRTNEDRRDGYLTHEMLERLDFIALGTYSYAPDCKGDILVTLQLIGKNGTTESFLGRGQPQYVMSQIASQIFSKFQATQFPSQIKVGKNQLTLIGGMNGSVDTAPTSELAVEFCQTLDARLPTAKELEILDGYGDWSGGISLEGKYWALDDNMVYAPHLKNPSPIRKPWEVNAEEVSYYCVQTARQ